MSSPGPIRSYKDLIAWQKAMALVKHVYALSSGFPATERFGLTSQVRRAAVSIPSNIAEGYGRRSKTDYIRFLDVARGSTNEVETQLLLAESLGFQAPANIQPILTMLDEVQRILRGLIQQLERNRTTGKPPAGPQASGLRPQA
jgi:four helix bundle protein